MIAEILAAAGVILTAGATIYVARLNGRQARTATGSSELQKALDGWKDQAVLLMPRIALLEERLAQTEAKVDDLEQANLLKESRLLAWQSFYRDLVNRWAWHRQQTDPPPHDDAH